MAKCILLTSYFKCSLPGLNGGKYSLQFLTSIDRLADEDIKIRVSEEAILFSVSISRSLHSQPVLMCVQVP